jgi:hypothetical protein
VHFCPVRRKASPSRSNHLRAKRARRGTSEAPVPRMMNPNAMDDGCLSVVSVGGCFWVHDALYDSPESAPRRHMRSRRRQLCDEVGALKLFYGRLARVGDTSRAQGYGAYRLLPVVFILLVESRNRARRELQGLVIWQRRLRRSHCSEVTTRMILLIVCNHDIAGSRQQSTRGMRLQERAQRQSSV